MQPLLYEINTRCWLSELSGRCGRRVTLEDVPESELTAWRQRGFSHIWLMGLWTSGPLARARALNDRELRKAFDAALPGWSDDDVEGSPYAIAAYKVPERLGGEHGLRRFRERLNKAGIRLVLDFVGNHLGLDHPWISDRPGLFVQSPGPAHEVFERPTVQGIRWFACGKDPYFPAWSDTVQLDYRLCETQCAMASVLSDIASVCDGVRCDMAMLMLSEVFARTWQRFPPAELARPADGEFWPRAIRQIKERFAGFEFVAEVYWGLEERLTKSGFDFVYEKELLDWLVARDGSRIARFLTSSHESRLAKGVHFLENHDEARAASRFNLAELKAATALILTLPGMRLLHEGQLTGARVRPPVHLSSRVREPARPEIEMFYSEILAVLGHARIGQGKFTILQPLPFTAGDAAPDSVVAILWQTSITEAAIVAVNLARVAVRFRLQVPACADSNRPTCIKVLYALASPNPGILKLGAGCFGVELLARDCVMARISSCIS